MTGTKSGRPSSRAMQRTIMADYFASLERAKEEGRKVVYTFVPGNLTELILSFDLLPVYPEINALQSAIRKRSMDHIHCAERYGHSEDVCTYVKCDIGMMLSGNIGATGRPLPPPDLLLLSYTGCFTFMKWFENLRSLYGCPAVMLHIPYQADGIVTEAMVAYVVRQLREEVIPALERVAGRPYDPGRIGGMCELAARAEGLFVDCLESAKQVPSPIDGYFGGVSYIAPIFTAFRGTQAAVDYYERLALEIDERRQGKRGPLTLEGSLQDERYRLVVEGPPDWTHFTDLWKMFYLRGAVAVASSYTRVGGVFDLGFRHDPQRPLESFARYCLGCYTNLSIPQRVELLCRWVREYRADGFLVNSIKSCNSFSAGQLLIMEEVGRRTGVPVGMIESDLVDARYFSSANIKNRLDGYFQMIDERRKADGRRHGD